MSDDRFAHFVSIQKGRLYQVARPHTEAYIAKTLKLHLSEPQWRQLVDQFGDHLVAQHRVYGAPDLLTLNTTQRLQTVDKEFTAFIKNAIENLPTEMNERRAPRGFRVEPAPDPLPIAKPVFRAPSKTTSLDSIANRIAYDPKDDRARRHADDMQAILELNLGYSVSDAKYLLRRKSPFIRARRAAEKAQQQLANNEVHALAPARRVLIQHGDLDLTVVAEESLRDDPVVGELNLLYLNIDVETAARISADDRQLAHELVDRAKRQLDLDVTKRIGQPAEIDLVWPGVNLGHGAAL